MHWFFIGVGLVLIVVYLSLASLDLPQLPSTVGDKINHFVAYGVLCGWFGQLFTRWQHRLVLAVFLVLLGILMEVLQGLTAYRFFDLLDACANSLGVVIGCLVLYLGADKLLKWFEKECLKVT